MPRRMWGEGFYLKGSTQAQIARELGVAQSTISDDLKAVRLEWRESRVRDFDEVVTMELQKLDRVERESWNAWERSQKTVEIDRVTQSGSGDRKVEKVMKQQVGNFRFLDQIVRCSASRRAWLGATITERKGGQSGASQERP